MTRDLSDVPLPRRKSETAAARKSKAQKEKEQLLKFKRKVAKVLPKVQQQDALDSIAPHKKPVDSSTSLTSVTKPNPKEKTIGWQPNSQVQIEFLAAWEDEVLFSGGRGSGKSDCLLIDPLRWVSNRNFRGLIIRRTMKELRELIDRAKRFYIDYFPGTKWKEQEKFFVFPSGAKIEFGYCDSAEDVEQYRGQQFTWLGIDEITQFADDTMLDKLKASLRSTDPSLPIYIRATTNPSGAGTRWVKARWVDEGPAGETIYKKYVIKGYNGDPDEEYTVTRKWFNSVPDDNKALSSQYKASLAAIENEVLRRQWLYGEWVTDGLAFDEFSLKTHVIKPFEIPNNWYKFRACDWGYSSMAVCLWFAVDFDDNIYVYREYATSKTLPDEFARNILEREAGEGVYFGVLDSSVWAERGTIGETPADTMIRAGCYWSPSDRSSGSRVAGKHLIHQYLAVDPDTKQPKLKVFNTCKELVKELSGLPLSPKNPEDVDTTACDHAYDALRYGLSSRPLTKSSYYGEFSSGGYERTRAVTPVDSIFGY